jgi:hypothetical protein
LTVNGNVSCNNITINDCSQNIHGFDTNLSITNPYSYTYPSTTSNGITLDTSVNDAFTDYACNQGFYLMANTVMNISASILTPINNLYTATLTTVQNVTNGSTNSLSYSFYCDDVSGSPTYVSLGDFSINNASSCSTQVSGIWVIYSNNTAPIFTITDLSLSNMGDYFYNSPLASYNITGGVTITNYQESTLNNVTGISGESLNSTISITNSSVTGGTVSNSYNKSITLSSINIYNIIGSATASSSLTNNVINVIVDPQSASLASAINPSKGIQTIGTIPTTGYRVWSAPSLINNSPPGIVPNLYISANSNIPNGTNGSTAIGYSDISYNNSWNISLSSSIYGVSSELLIANGSFTTSSSYYLNYDASYSDGVQNTVNYSLGNMYQGYRYATFAWIMPYNTSGITVTINFINTMYKNTTNGYAYFDSTTSSSPLQLFYRFGDTLQTDNFGLYNTNKYYPNTTWISLNSDTGNSYISAVNGYSSTLSPLWDSTVTINYNSSLSITYTTGNFPSSNYDFTSDTIYLYVRVGIPYSSTTTNYGFSSINCSLKSS